MNTPRDEYVRVRYVDVVAFACKVAMFIVLIAGVNTLVDGWRHWLISLAAVVVVAAVWARWVAADSPHRLDDPARFVVQAVLFVGVGTLAALAGLLWVGLGFSAVSVAAFAATRSDRAL
jgi:hypothetical protein